MALENTWNGKKNGGGCRKLVEAVCCEEKDKKKKKERNTRREQNEQVKENSVGYLPYMHRVWQGKEITTGEGRDGRGRERKTIFFVKARNHNPFPFPFLPSHPSSCEVLVQVIRKIMPEEIFTTISMSPIHKVQFSP